MSTVSDYTEAASQLPDEFFLGQIIWFTISEADVPLERARQELETRNLRTETLRKRLRPIDAFKKACNEIAHKFDKSEFEQHTIMVRPVGQDTDSSHRHIVLERAIYKTGQRRRLEYDILASVVYDRGYRIKDIVHEGQITVQVNDLIGGGGYQLNSDEKKWLDEHLGPDGKILIGQYEHWCTHLDSHAVRSFVREYLYTLGTISIRRNGSLYFVPQKHVDELRDLSEWVRSIGSQMRLMPLLDIVEQRDMLAEAFIDETLDEVRALSAAMAAILNDQKRTITEDTYDTYVQNALALINKQKEYQGLLDRDLDAAATQLDILRTQALSLDSKVRRPKSLGGGQAS